jgi:diguanylate cyclase (GGDEF)-like protein/PAS domain S-box-containing protein
VVVTDAELNTLRVNNAFTRITGYSKRESIGRRLPILSKVHDHLLRHRSWNDEVIGRRKNGEAYPARLRVKAVFDEEERVTHYVASFHDLSAKKALQDRVQQATQIDPMTGLPNRAAVFKTLQHVDARATAFGALVLIDLDHFKDINARWGYAGGDAVLCQVARRLAGVFRRTMALSRFGGDAFLLVLEGVGADPDQAAAHARGVAQSVQQCLAAPFAVGGQECRLNASVGVTVFCGQTATAEAVVRQVEGAMYAAKQAGGGCVRVHPMV